MAAGRSRARTSLRSDLPAPGCPLPSAIYQVNNWPDTPWREVTQDRLVAPEFVSREPIFPWEAKVYTLA